MTLPAPGPRPDQLPPTGPVVVLVGAPGSGKSTVGRLLAERLGVPFADVDELIEVAAGKPVAEVFADDGEPYFRELEVAHTLAALDGPGVLSLGGGAVTSAAIRAALVGRTVVWLQVGAASAARRVGLTTARPLLLGNVRSQLVRLLDQRTPLYTEVATLTVPTDDLLPETVLDAVLAGLPAQPDRVRVDAGQPYDVVIGHGLAAEVTRLVGSADQVALIHPAPLTAVAETYRAALVATGARVHLLPVPDAEPAKTAEVLTRCWSSLGDWGFTRSDVVVGIGGGATTDLAGFVAATWLRGVRLVTVPTTLLGLVDAAVGGKTGINTPHGKNLVGGFYEPDGVVGDLDRLATLPPDDLRAGLAEVVKCGFIADPVILDRIEATDGPPTANLELLRELVVRSVRVKAAVVSRDLREATSVGSQVGRELLNYGHTLAHAIERREDYRWRHGDAVSVGLVFAAELSRRAGILDDATADRHRSVLAGLGLPVSYAPDAFDELLAAMALDKKSRGATLRFVVLEGLARARILAGPDPAVLRAAYAALHP